MTPPLFLPLSNLATQLWAGRPVMLLPTFAPLQAPDMAHALVAVSCIHPMDVPGLLRLDLDGDAGPLLVEDRRGGRRND